MNSPNKTKEKCPEAGGCGHPSHHIELRAGDLPGHRQACRVLSGMRGEAASDTVGAADSFCRADRFHKPISSPPTITKAPQN
jgi:hypothetical protein